MRRKIGGIFDARLPSELEELQASYAYPEGENAAFLYADAFSKIVITDKQEETILGWRSQAEWKAFQGKVSLETLQALSGNLCMIFHFYRKGAI